MSMLGKLFHLSLDAVLVSAVLAGIKRSSGLSLNVDTISNDTTRPYILRYLDFGEWVFDQSIFWMSRSTYFSRNNSNNK
ncbi:DUF1748-domain-containing protein [Neoconidiobolus thromboides FSU 785]|nr:DUF1748-domain-containing protein [Neoconidiobolus thromboides FSU 785]